jgi:hypothetical protein
MTTDLMTKRPIRPVTYDQAESHVYDVLDNLSGGLANEWINKNFSTRLASMVRSALIVQSMTKEGCEAYKDGLKMLFVCCCNRAPRPDRA